MDSGFVAPMSRMSLWLVWPSEMFRQTNPQLPLRLRKNCEISCRRRWKSGPIWRTRGGQAAAKRWRWRISLAR